MALAALAAWSASAHAQILEIGADGATRVYAGPVARTAEGVRALAAPASSGPPSPATPEGLGSEIATAARRHALAPGLVQAVAQQESGLRQEARSPKGAIGVMQLMPSTAQALGVDPRQRRQNIEGGAAYLAAMLKRFDGNLVQALAAYNAGPGAVDAHRGVAPYAETRSFVSGVLERLAKAAAGEGHGVGS